MILFKKMMIALILTFTLGVGSVSQSQAALMAAFPAALGAINSTLFSLLALGGIIGVHEYNDKYKGHLKAVFWGYVALGLIMESDSQKIQFQILDHESALKLKITSEELESYNLEVNRVNALLEEATLRLSQSDKAEQQDVAQEIYNSIKSELSPLTFSAIQKIAKANLVIK